MTLEIWHIWVIAALVLFIAEIFTPGFVLACFALACLLTALIAFFELSLTLQIITFSFASLLVFFGIRPIFLRYSYFSPEKIKTNTEALIGKTGVVLETVDPANNSGRVKVGGEDWKGKSDDENVIEAGTRIQVVNFEGVKLIVKPLANQKEE